MILIRADGNPKIGMGHIMRCLSFAEALRAQGIEVVFVIAEQDFQGLIENYGYRCIVLKTAYNCMEEELSVFLSVLEQERPILVVLDSYFVTAKYMRAIKNTVPLLYIDDQNAFDYPADIVVNYDLGSSKIAYPSGKKYLLGPQYALLRKEFQGLERRSIKERVERILISTGGTDPYHIMLNCAEYLRITTLFPNVTFHLILGTMNQDVVRVQKATSGCSFIELHDHVTNMCSLMMKSDLAISAAGTTLYELCACGLPTVTYILADNQKQSAKDFQEAGLMFCAGDVRYDKQFLDHLFMKLRYLIDNRDKQKQMARKMQKLVDGNGAKRLTETLLRYLQEEVK
ncbi:MAG: UDP-2,4-diacetamido-2,4,6-trideoxy-beta-L-altropyranose hydrolase [Ruminococcus sp.]|nr:UDP-2,4-diacetamido-2,4,6-trideoxy-beta-L-altropyranose hydrolase [Ruminococcus sp.]